MRSVDVFFYLRLNKQLSKQSWSWWFQTPSRSLWHHCNGHDDGSRISVLVLTRVSGITGTNRKDHIRIGHIRMRFKPERPYTGTAMNSNGYRWSEHISCENFVEVNDIPMIYFVILYLALQIMFIFATLYTRYKELPTPLYWIHCLLDIPLFMVRLWNNGTRRMSNYVLIHICRKNLILQARNTSQSMKALFEHSFIDIWRNFLRGLWKTVLYLQSAVQKISI